MDGWSNYVHVRTDEGNVTGSKTVSWDIRSRKILITNDNTSGDLGVRLKNANQDKLTLKPKETLTIYYNVYSLVLEGSNINYRVWMFA